MNLQKRLAALRIETTTTGAGDVEAMINRVAKLDLLYEASGRGNKRHPFHGLYTGLHQERCPF